MNSRSLPLKVTVPFDFQEYRVALASFSSPPMALIAFSRIDFASLSSGAERAGENKEDGRQGRWSKNPLHEVHLARWRKGQGLGPRSFAAPLGPILPGQTSLNLSIPSALTPCSRICPAYAR